MTKKFSPCGEIVRAGDPDRFRTALFAEPEKREHLFALYAFNLEIAKIAPMVSEPMLGEIRLQWWREAIEAAYTDGTVRSHEVVEPLTRAIREKHLLKRCFDLIIDARAQDLDPAFPENSESLKKYLGDTGGSLAILACIASGAIGDKSIEVVQDIGTAIAIARYLEAAPILIEQGKRTFAHEPETSDSEQDHDGKSETVRTQTDPHLAEAVRSLAEYGLERLVLARKHRGMVPKENTPALLEARLAEPILRHHNKQPMDWEKPAPSKLRVLWGGFCGRW